MSFLVSKASILSLILQLVLGFSIFTTAHSSITSSASSMEEQAQKMFNMKFTVFEGTQSGSVIKQLISSININNEDNNTPNVKMYLDNQTNFSDDDIVVTQKYNVYFHYGDDGYIDGVRINTISQ